VARYAKSDKQNAKHEEEGDDIRSSLAQGFRNAHEPFRDGNVLEDLEPHLPENENCVTEFRDYVLGLGYRIRGERFVVFTHHESVDRVDHCVTVGEVGGSEQFGCTDEIGIGTHTAKQHHGLELKISGNKE
jgi:hypothetical protein